MDNVLDGMRRTGKNKGDERWLKQLGLHLESLIKEKGYTSSYDFWVKKAGDQISRAALNYVLAGRVDVKVTTLRAIAKMLGIGTKKLFEFES